MILLDAPNIIFSKPTFHTELVETQALYHLVSAPGQNSFKNSLDPFGNEHGYNEEPSEIKTYFSIEDVNSGNEDQSTGGQSTKTVYDMGIDTTM